MKLTIITINYNNIDGLERTMHSVLSQSSDAFEYVVVDGGSTDGSKDVIGQLAADKRLTHWVSEPDTGIYNAMNKGIQMSKGEYVQFVNSGDYLVDELVTEKMLDKLSQCNEPPQIFYGNMLKQLTKGLFRDKGFEGRQPTMLDFYTGTLNHSSAYIKRNLFDIFGLYDESFKIVSDWKWYLQSIIFGGITPAYIDVDVTIFDMTGISTINSMLDRQERNEVLALLFPAKVLADYDQYAFAIEQWQRIQRYKYVAKIYWLIERCLFKWEKIKFNRLRSRS
jgi:glycosyltransferase involved in cell wall biosynthesis